MSRARKSLIGVWALLGLSLQLSMGCNGASPSVSDANRPTTPSASAPAASSDEKPKALRPEGDPQPTLPMGKVELEIENRQLVTLDVEVASQPKEQQMGLMFRESMPENAGMIFLFPTQRHQSFWMRNTLIPLDMFFIDSNWKVVGVVENAEPLTEDPREVQADSQYVLEVNAGFAKKHGFGPGTKVRYLPPGGT